MKHLIPYATAALVALGTHALAQQTPQDPYSAKVHFTKVELSYFCSVPDRVKIYVDVRDKDGLQGMYYDGGTFNSILEDQKGIKELKNWWFAFSILGGYVNLGGDIYVRLAPLEKEVKAAENFIKQPRKIILIDTKGNTTKHPYTLEGLLKNPSVEKKIYDRNKSCC